jgi:hypothetical protein
MDLDTQQIIAEVATKHGLVIDAQDPIIALATVNAIVLEQVTQRAGEDISARIAEFKQAVAGLERRAGEALGEQTAKLIRELREQLGREISSVAQQGMPETKHLHSVPLWLTILLSVVLFVLGIISGKLL